MAPTRKKATRTTRKKTTDQNFTTIPTNATLSPTDDDDDNEIQTNQNRESENKTEKQIEEQVEYNNSNLPTSNIVTNVSNKHTTTETINHKTAGTTRQQKTIMESGGVTDYISITDRTETMSSISQDKAEIAVHIPELFHLKKFICSDNELISTGKVATFFFKQMSIPERYREEWWAASVSKIRKSIDQKRATVAMSIKIEFMRKY